MRILKIGLVLLVAFWALTSLQGNLAALDATYGVIAHVLSMPSFPAGEAPPFATQNPAVIWTFTILLMVSKIVSLAICLAGAYRMWKARAADGAAFQRAKQVALIGCAFTMGWLFLGFTTIGENIFLMYLDETGTGSAETAFRISGSIGLITLIVALADEDQAKASR